MNTQFSKGLSSIHHLLMLDKNELTLSKYFNKLNNLHLGLILASPKLAFIYVRQHQNYGYVSLPDDIQNRLKQTISTDPHYALDYANVVIRGKFSLGEKAISKTADTAYYYAKHILNGLFPLGEPAIATNAYYSYNYAKYILKGSFPLGEPVIEQDLKYSYCYKQFINYG